MRNFDYQYQRRNLRQTFIIGLLVALLFWSWGYQIVNDIGVAGINRPVFWGFYIVNFVFWIGISHAGTLISAILLLFKQDWRTSINRFAEAMTLFAVACAAMFPLLHTGRPWLAAYWLFPYPNTMDLWPQFRSPLMWDVFAVSTYATVSALFWYVGLIPDLATVRDREKGTLRGRIFGLLQTISMALMPIGMMRWLLSVSRSSIACRRACGRLFRGSPPVRCSSRWASRPSVRSSSASPRCGTSR